jgi:hypothetical protein
MRVGVRVRVKGRVRVRVIVGNVLRMHDIIV